MRIPFLNRIERRAEGYTEAIIAQLIDTADTVDCAVRLDRSRGGGYRPMGEGLRVSANVTPSGPIADALTPTVMQMIGRNLAEYGESLWVIEVEGGALAP